MIVEHTLQKRGGRPRRIDVERDEHGRIKDHHYREDPRTLPAWNRYRDVAKEMMMDARMATQRGKLFYTGQLKDYEFEAANRWADMLELYDKLVLGRNRTPASPALERRGHGVDNWDDPKRVMDFKASFAKAHGELAKQGRTVEGTVNRLCRDETAGAMLPDAKRGLAVLAAHFGLLKVKR